MKKTFIFLLTLVLAVTVAFFWGCSDDDNGMNSGSLDDPEFEAFGEGFDMADDVTGQMFDLTFGFVGQLLDPVEGKNATNDYFEYHSNTQYWYCSTTVIDDEVEYAEYAFVDTIQFWHGDYIVQWPKEDSLTQILTYAFVRPITPPDFMDSLYAEQGGALSLPQAGSDTLTINGSGSFYADLSDTIEDDYDTTVCEVLLDYDIDYDDLSVYISAMGNEESDACPFEGVLTFNGEVDISCTSTDQSSVSVSGEWNVAESFDDGTITITVTHGNTVWTITEDCDTGMPIKQ